MEQPRCIETGKESFFGGYIYDQVIPADHFLRKLNQVIAWEHYTGKLIGLYEGKGIVGRPPFGPTMLLKMELLAYLHNLSEWQVENYLNENLPAKYFVGLAVDKRVPDHSTLTVFRERLVQRGKWKLGSAAMIKFRPQNITQQIARCKKQFPVTHAGLEPATR